MKIEHIVLPPFIVLNAFESLLLYAVE
jgi:hypothetical protein